MRNIVPSTAALRAEHAEIVRLADRLLAAIDAERPPPELPGIRRQLRQALDDHFRHEDWIVYPWVFAWAEEPAAEAARRLYCDTADLGGAILTHVNRWTQARAEAGWTAYGEEVRRLIGRLKERIVREESELYAAMEAMAGDAA